MRLRQSTSAKTVLSWTYLLRRMECHATGMWTHFGAAVACSSRHSELGEEVGEEVGQEYRGQDYGGSTGISRPSLFDRLGGRRRPPGAQAASHGQTGRSQDVLNFTLSNLEFVCDLGF
jgi:hypothetical protein